MGWLSILMLAFQLGKLVWQLLPIIREIFNLLHGQGHSLEPLMAAMRESAVSGSEKPLRDLHERHFGCAERP